jgi:predicted TIM-barrel fold metal-dependent hydrolase
MSRRQRLCIDMHVHLGHSKDGAQWTWRDIQKLHRRYSITHSVLFPIDETEPGPSYSRLNSRIASLMRQTKQIIGFCRLDPSQPNVAYEELVRSVKLGLRGVKFHPRSENFSPSDVQELLLAIEKEKLPVVLHTSHEHHCHPASWEGIFLRHKKISFVLAHAGKDAYLEAEAVAGRCPNVYLDTSTLSYRRTAVLLKKLGSRKIVFASDAPYSHPAIEILKFSLILERNSPAWRSVFEENPKRILGGLP